jgi:hypothetical protein
MEPLKYATKIANLQDYVLSNTKEYLEIVFYTVIAFSVPLFLAHPQILVGTVVNAMLITSALNIKGYKLLPIILAPSLGALSAGILFGQLNIFLVYLVPFIWISNAILVFSFKIFKFHKKYNYVTTLIIGSVSKASFLFITSYLLFKLNIIPSGLLSAMGIIQLITALSGGLLAYSIHVLKQTNFTNVKFL